jgi:hypothetical protein
LIGPVFPPPLVPPPPPPPPQADNNSTIALSSNAANLVETIEVEGILILRYNIKKYEETSHSTGSITPISLVVKLFAQLCAGDSGSIN